MTDDVQALKASIKKLRADKRKLAGKIRGLEHCHRRRDTTVLRIELELHEDGENYNLQTMCSESTPFERVEHAFRQAAKVIGKQLREKRSCPFHPEFDATKNAQK